MSRAQRLRTLEEEYERNRAQRGRVDREAPNAAPTITAAEDDALRKGIALIVLLGLRCLPEADQQIVLHHECEPECASECPAYGLLLVGDDALRTHFADVDIPGDFAQLLRWSQRWQSRYEWIPDVPLTLTTSRSTDA